MLDKNRVKEAEINVRNYLKEGLIKKIDNPENSIKNIFIKNSRESLKIAGLKADELIISFDSERIKRNRIQYNTAEQVKHSKAQTSLERAKKFVFEMERLLEIEI